MILLFFASDENAHFNGNNVFDNATKHITPSKMQTKSGQSNKNTSFLDQACFSNVFG